MIGTEPAFDDGERSSVHRLSFVVLSLSFEKRSNQRELSGHLRMIRTEGLLPNICRSSGEWLACRKLTARVFDDAELMKNGGRLRMFESQGYLSNRQRPVVQARGPLVCAGVPVVHTEVVQRACDIAVLAAEGPLGKHQRILQHRLRLLISAQCTNHVGQPANRLDPKPLGLEIARIRCEVQDVVRAPVVRTGARVVSEVFTCGGQTEQHADDIGVVGTGLSFEDRECPHGETLAFLGPSVFTELVREIKKQPRFLDPIRAVKVLVRIEWSHAGTCFGVRSGGKRVRFDVRPGNQCLSPRRPRKSNWGAEAPPQTIASRIAQNYWELPDISPVPGQSRALDRKMRRYPIG
jgi:hypothetical protein